MSESHPLVQLEVLVLIAIGGFAGANVRWFVGDFVPGLEGTILVNIVGSVALGFIVGERDHIGLLAEETGVVLGTGFLSSFTTYSTFALQTVRPGSLPSILAVVAVTYGLGFLGALLGLELARGVGSPGVSFAESSVFDPQRVRDRVMGLAPSSSRASSSDEEAVEGDRP